MKLSDASIIMRNYLKVNHPSMSFKEIEALETLLDAQRKAMSRKLKEEEKRHG